MSDRYHVSVKVISQEGKCVQELKIGDEWVITNKTPGGLCLGAFASLLPKAYVLSFGGSFPWSPDPDAVTVACPDAENPVVFELRRLAK